MHSKLRNSKIFILSHGILTLYVLYLSVTFSVWRNVRMKKHVINKTKGWALVQNAVILIKILKGSWIIRLDCPFNLVLSPQSGPWWAWHIYGKTLRIPNACLKVCFLLLHLLLLLPWLPITKALLCKARAR